MNLIEYIATYKELLGYIAAGLSTTSFLPQVIKIWRSRSGGDISTIMYVMYIISLLLWLLYGVIIGSTPLILAEVVTLILASAILIMKFMWR